MKHYALLSVFDKTDIQIIAKSLVDSGYEIIATEGTGSVLSQHQINFIPAAKMSGNPDALKDCIQTIGFQLSAGILFNRKNQSHINQVDRLKVNPIDIVVCNFPPVGEVIRKPDDFNIQHVDVGGPLMVRAAATNYRQVLVLTQINDYQNVAFALNDASITEDMRKELAIKAFHYCQDYDRQVEAFLKSI